MARPRSKRPLVKVSTGSLYRDQLPEIDAIVLEVKNSRRSYTRSDFVREAIDEKLARIKAAKAAAPKEVSHAA